MIDAAIDADAEINKYQTFISEDEMAEEAKLEVADQLDDSIFDLIEACSFKDQDEYKILQYGMLGLGQQRNFLRSIVAKGKFNKGVHNTGLIFFVPRCNFPSR